jgi:hypothetical protein
MSDLVTFRTFLYTLQHRIRIILYYNFICARLRNYYAFYHLPFLLILFYPYKDIDYTYTTSTFCSIYLVLS